MTLSLGNNIMSNSNQIVALVRQTNSFKIYNFIFYFRPKKMNDTN